ncbi:MAG: TraB/GumN family protein [Deltaproteobacteria bacterium]|jgi:uncharacterized protein YbaP (TraB family)|nr:TraB/GumN family protein [Deltaproteobacteria bacterium]
MNFNFKQLKLTLSALITTLIILVYSCAGRADNMLWLVENKSGAKLYLLGSLHMAKPDLYPLSSTIEEAFSQSSQLVVEVDVSDTEQITKMALSFMGDNGLFSNPNGAELWSVLDSQTAQSLKEALSKANLPQEFFAKMRPWAVAFNLETLVLLTSGYDIELGIDHHFLKAAKQKGLKINQLESFDEQLNVFANLSDEQSIDFLKSVLAEIDNFEPEMTKLIQYWRDGDEKSFELAYFNIYDKHPQLKPILDKLIIERNRTMSERLLPFFNSPKPSFAVIGCAHLVGPEGLPALFKQKGYIITKY